MIAWFIYVVSYRIMISDTLKELETAKSKVAELEASVKAELHRELAALPARYGFGNVNAFTKAVKAAASGKAGRGRKAGKKRTRAVITDGIRAEVKKLAAAGKSGTEIAKAVKISLPSVQNIKKALGLVKSRK